MLSSTSTGHQPKISHVFTVLLKATHLPVRMPGEREKVLGAAGGAGGTLQAPSLGLPIDEAPKSRSPRKEVWLGLGQGRPRSGWQEGRGQKGHPGGGGLELKRAEEGTGGGDLTLGLPFRLPWSAATVVLADAPFRMLGEGRAAGSRPLGWDPEKSPSRPQGPREGVGQSLRYFWGGPC